MTDLQKILIVDDREENLFALEKVLAGIEAQFIRAGGGNDALKASLHHDFALAILDVQMPEMDGYELAEFLRSDPRTEHLPIIFLSAVYRDDYHVFKGYEAGAVDFITKPYNPKILASKVRFFLQIDRQKTRLRNQVEIEQAKNYLENILAAMADLFIAVGADGRIETCNRRGLALVGLDADEVVGEPLSLIVDAPLCTDWLARLGAAGPTPAADGDIFQNQETSLRSRDGRRVPVLLSGSALRSPAGEFAGAVFLAKDIRQRKLLERQLRQAQKMDTVALLAGGIAHDFNNLLTMILGNLEMLAETLPLTCRDNPFLAEAIHACSQAGRLTRKFTSFSTAEQPVKKCIALRELLVHTVDRALNGSPLQARYKVADDLWPAEVDAGQMAQLLTNLVKNAKEASQEGGAIEVEATNIVTPADEPLKGVALQARPYIRIVIRDHGHGIASHHQAKIFDPYYSTKEMGAEKGMGLGLTIAYAIVRKHDGQIQVDSTPGQGTTVTVYLPAALTPDQPPADASATDAPPA